jgi:cyanophycinase
MDHQTPGPIALVGSGEYLPVLEPLERALLAGRPSRYVQLATAAAPEGPAVLRRWHELGARAAKRLGVEQVVVPVVDRNTAQDPALADLVRGAGLVYLSGGSPRFLTETLQDTAVWAAIRQVWRSGAALAGCSAGAMALSAGFPDLRHPWRRAVSGLGLVPTVEVLPHFDRFAARVPDPVLRGVSGAGPGVGVVGIDEDTALVGGLEPGAAGWRTDPAGPDSRWQVFGRQSAWLLGPDGRHRVPAGSWTRLGPAVSVRGRPAAPEAR